MTEERLERLRALANGNYQDVAESAVAELVAEVRAIREQTYPGYQREKALRIQAEAALARVTEERGIANRRQRTIAALLDAWEDSTPGHIVQQIEDAKRTLRSIRAALEGSQV